MNLNRIRRSTTDSDDLLCAQVESYVHWRAQSRLVAESYRAWRRAETKERNFAFARYVAALDREEVAAGDYRRMLELVDQRWRRPRSAPGLRARWLRVMPSRRRRAGTKSLGASGDEQRPRRPRPRAVPKPPRKAHRTAGVG
jgi:hypothetical protein